MFIENFFFQVEHSPIKYEWFLNIFIWPILGIPTVAIILSQSGTRSTCKERILLSFKFSRTIKSSLVSYSGDSGFFLGWGMWKYSSLRRMQSLNRYPPRQSIECDTHSIFEGGTIALNLVYTFLIGRLTKSKEPSWIQFFFSFSRLVALWKLMDWVKFSFSSSREVALPKPKSLLKFSFPSSRLVSLQKQRAQLNSVFLHLNQLPYQD